MRKSAYIFFMAIAMMVSLSAFTSCREQKTTGDKIEDAADAVGDDIENTADDVGDGIEDAADDVEDAVD
ncbi:hypothetical protein [Formosa sp. L2A11]|uniref:hypothetical protein n=1 Tax=Formosa sp. L2A11 TaxID=2686363 RepID=UPI00131AB959|nr:hypothetical protein [Formosa sp. L2A11]